MFKIVIKQAQPFLFNRLRQDRFLERERFCWVKVVPHYPRERNVVACGDKVGKAVNGSAAAVEPPRLHRLGVAADRLQLEAGNGLILVRHRFKLSGLDHRPPVLRQVAGTVAFVRVFGVLEFAFGNEIAGVLEMGDR